MTDRYNELADEAAEKAAAFRYMAGRDGLRWVDIPEDAPVWGSIIVSGDDPRSDEEIIAALVASDPPAADRPAIYYVPSPDGRGGWKA
jgi:hypothetical protein